MAAYHHAILKYYYLSEIAKKDNQAYKCADLMGVFRYHIYLNNTIY